MKLSIKMRLLALSGAGLVAMATMGVVGLVEISRISDSLARTNITAAAIRNQGDADMMHDALRADVLDVLRWAAHAGAGAPDDLARLQRAVTEHSGRLRDMMHENAGLDLPAASHQAVLETIPETDAYARAAEDLLAQAERNPAHAETSFPAFVAAFESLETRMAGLSDQLEAEVTRERAQGDATLAESRWAMLGTALLALAIFTLLGLLTLRAILRPLAHARQASRRVAAGDLSAVLTPERQDEIGELVSDLEQMRLGLRRMIAGIERSAAEIASAATEMRAAVDSVSDASDRQAGAASSVASAIGQLSATTSRVAERARDSARMAHDSGRTSAQGASAMREASDQMNQIVEAVDRSSELVQTLGAHSEHISRIVSVIRDIAEQTNLLALNAAIEAARAGEQGRGFAVVADEVRKLSERTASSTVEIAGMIDNVRSGTAQAVAAMHQGTDRVRDGVTKNARISASMQDIQRDSELVLTAVEDISAALGEQSQASGQISNDIGQIAQLSEDNAAALAEMVNAVQMLETLAHGLTDSVRQFRLH